MNCLKGWSWHTDCPLPTGKRNSYVRMLFIDYSSTFETIVPTNLITKLRTLGLNTSLCNWILDILTGRPQVVRVGNLNFLVPVDIDLVLVLPVYNHDITWYSLYVTMILPGTSCI